MSVDENKHRMKVVAVGLMCVACMTSLMDVVNVQN